MNEADIKEILEGSLATAYRKVKEAARKDAKATERGNRKEGPEPLKSAEEAYQKLAETLNTNDKLRADFYITVSSRYNLEYEQLRWKSIKEEAPKKTRELLEEHYRIHKKINEKFEETFICGEIAENLEGPKKQEYARKYQQQDKESESLLKELQEIEEAMTKKAAEEDALLETKEILELGEYLRDAGYT